MNTIDRIRRTILSTNAPNATGEPCRKPLGKGVEKDWKIAKQWYGMAKNQGHRTAELFLERLEQEQNIAELDSNFSMTLIAD